MAKHHWHAMNGSSGCIPDNNQVFGSKVDAVRYLCDLFDERGLFTSLMTKEVYFFRRPRRAGADYAEIVRCEESECSEEDY